MVGVLCGNGRLNELPRVERRGVFVGWRRSACACGRRKEKMLETAVMLSPTRYIWQRRRSDVQYGRCWWEMDVVVAYAMSMYGYGYGCATGREAPRIATTRRDIPTYPWACGEPLNDDNTRFISRREAFFTVINELLFATYRKTHLLVVFALFYRWWWPWPWTDMFGCNSAIDGHTSLQMHHVPLYHCSNDVGIISTCISVSHIVHPSSARTALISQAQSPKPLLGYSGCHPQSRGQGCRFLIEQLNMIAITLHGLARCQCYAILKWRRFLHRRVCTSSSSRSAGREYQNRRRDLWAHRNYYEAKLTIICK